MKTPPSLWDPSDLFGEEDRQLYERGMKVFYLQLVHLNTNIFILQRIANFPFGLLSTPEESIFFRMVLENFVSASLLIITRIATDQGKDVFTLPRFKNWVRQHIRREYRADFDARLKEVKFDKNTKALLVKAQEVRDRHIAHLTMDIVAGTPPAAKVFLCELVLLRDALNPLLDALAFNVDHVLLPLEYTPWVSSSGQVRAQPDIEVLLDCVARRSVLLNMPDASPEEWIRERSRLSDEEIAILNRYRKKFNLPEV